MTLAGGTVLRWLVIAVLASATIGMFVISMRGNYLYGYSIGQSEEKRALFGWANVAADVWKAFGLVAVTMLWRHRHRQIALVGSIAWVVCLLSGLNSAIGVYVQDRSTLTGTREGQHLTYTQVQNELEHATEKLKSLTPHRSVAEVDAVIAAHLARPIVVGDRVRGTVATLSDQCKKVDARTVAACAEIASFQSERAVAVEAENVEGRTQELRHQIATLRERGGSLPADPVGEFYAWATRGLLSVRDVSFSFPLFFALLIEIVSAFGPLTVVRFAELSATQLDMNQPLPGMARHSTPRPALTFNPEETGERVAAWMAQRATPRTDGGAITIEELHRDYSQWSRTEGHAAWSLADFASAFDRLRDMPELTGKIRKFGNRYYGITIRQSSIRELPLQSR